jgi:predicted nuclease of predicted toxin-antitoxin system
MTRLLLDQGIARSTASILTGAGWDVLHVADIGMERSTDAVILDYARTQQRIICTLDADFHALLAVSGQDSPSVVRIRWEGLRGDALAQLLTRIWPDIVKSVTQGAAVSVTEHSIRIRRLPVTAVKSDSSS